MPPWARNWLLARLSNPDQFKVWANDIFDPATGRRIQADTHHPIGVADWALATLHLHTSAFGSGVLLRILCHEAAHSYFDLRHDAAEFDNKVRECIDAAQ
jgi:hypothetical protein